MADSIISTATEAKVAAEVVTVKSKIVTYVKAHATPTTIGTAAGFVVGKFGIIGAILKLI